MTDEQRAVLMERFAETRTDVLARELGVCYRTLCRWAAELGLTKSQDFRTGISAIGGERCSEHYGDKHPKPGRPILDDDMRAYMQQHFATTPNMVLARVLGVNDRTVRRWASALGLKKDSEVIELHRRSQIMPTPEEWFCTVATIRELYPDGRDEEIAERTGYTIGYIGDIAKRYGIQRTAAYREAVKERNREMRKRICSEAKADRRWVKPRTLAMEEELRKSYADTPTPELARRFGVTEMYVKIIAGRLGLKKSPEFVRRVRIEAQKKRKRRTKDRLRCTAETDGRGR